MDILCNLLDIIINFNLYKWEEPKKRIRRIDVLDYALVLADYLLNSIEDLDREFVFMGKFAIDYLVNEYLLELSNESKDEKELCNKKMQELCDKSQKINYSIKINSFDEFIASFNFPLINTESDAPEVISRGEFYDNADDLYRMMWLAVVRPNDRLLRKYNKHYKAVKLEYIKMIAEAVIKEVKKYNIELNEADRQFIQLCNLINTYLTIDEKSPYYRTAEGYITNSMLIMVNKCRENNK